MQFSNLSALSIPELKAIAAQLDCTLNGDKRAKQSWIDAIELAQYLETLVAPVGETEAEWEVRASECIGLGEVLDEIINGTDIDKAIPDCTIGMIDLELHAEVDINMGLSDSEMECAAVAFDFAPASSKKSLSNLILSELAQPTTSQPNPHQEAVESEDSNWDGSHPHIPTKKGAVTVIGALLVLLIFALTATCSIAHTIVKYTAIIINIFVGGYNSDYDFWYQIQTLAQQRQPLPVQQA